MKKHVNYFLIIFYLVCIRSSAQTGLPPGYPDHSSSFDVLPGFVNPPKGYGEVPFYWWQGDTITRERLLWQLDQLKDKGISSLQINYSHKDYGGLTYGLSNPSKPALFTDSWWDLFKWFAAEAQKRDMTVSLSDYTIGIGQGFSMDEAIKKYPELNGSLLRSSTSIITGKGEMIMPENLLSLTAYKIDKDSSLIIETRKDFLPLVKNSKLYYKIGHDSWKIIAVYPERLIPSYNPMHKESGNAYNRYFFEKFENALPDKGSGALNFFFSDELNFRLNGNLWDESFADEFKKRKGYDLVPYLDALFVNIGSITPKIKLDYNDVIVSLSEENFFKPVYQWHQDRGMIFGCDHGGRGMDLTEFGDYFRTQRWNQGPGSDQPRLSKDIIKAKVASSIAHLYNRQRVWLEGFHSSGWGTSSADVTDAVLANFVAGYNLLSFHGLYYSTMGGWWEWAPPCNHFRMPYWQQIDPFMDCIQRLSFLLSQGFHKCDIAIIYPTEPVIAEMEGEKSVSDAFRTGEELYNKGIDFDFIDYESIARADIKNGELNVAGEKYKVLIVPSMRAIHYSSLKKLEEFKNAGGIIVNIGAIPEVTEKNGAQDWDVLKLAETIFSKSKNLILCENPEDVPSVISGKYEADFKILSKIEERPYIMHRTIGDRDLFALYNFPAGSKCFFKAHGSVQLWNPWNGETNSLSEFAKQSAEGTEVTLPLSEKEIQLIVFTPESPESRKVIYEKTFIRQYDLGNKWEFELNPSLDNRWGDFQLPPTNELLGAQVRQLYFKEDYGYSGEAVTPDSTWERVTCAFGTQFLKLGALPEIPDLKELLKIKPSKAGEAVTLSGKKYKWEEYSFSWQHGVEGDYGHQGYHGLKGEMYNNFIRLGALEDVKMSLKRIPESEGNYYILYTSVIAPSDGIYGFFTGDLKPAVFILNDSITDADSKTISLKQGANPIMLIYNHACETYLIVRRHGTPPPVKQPVSMCWYRDFGVLPFDCLSDKNSTGLFAFESAPGLRSFTFSAYGKVKIWIDGIETEAISGQIQPDGLTDYSVNISDMKPFTSHVVLKISYQSGYHGAAAIPHYFNQQCGKGYINLGDWSEVDGLRAYSGGAWYRKTIEVNAMDLKNDLEIDLGDLVSSAELLINGKSAGIRLSPPWTFDISGKAIEGENRIEVLVYNTLANNYTSIPTRYRGEIKSGITGPVTFRVINHSSR